MPHYEPKADSGYAGLGKVIVLQALFCGLLAGLLTLLIGTLAPSWPSRYWTGISLIISLPLAIVFSSKLWPDEYRRLRKMRLFRGW